MLNQIEYLLDCLGEEGCEVSVRASKAIRFGLIEIQPGQTEDNKRRLEREVADVIGVARMLGLHIREEDIVQKIVKVQKFMDYSREVGVLEMRGEVRGTCPGCGCSVPEGFYACGGSGSHPEIQAQKS